MEFLLKSLQQIHVAVQLLSRVQLFAKDCSTPGFLVLYCLLEFAQTHVHWFNDTIQPSHSLLSLNPPALNLSQHQGLFQWVDSSHQVASASVLPIHIEGWFPLGLTCLISCLSKGLSRVFSSTTAWKHQFFSTQPSLWSNSDFCKWLLEKPLIWLCGPLSAN